jgi:hypothetical protein
MESNKQNQIISLLETTLPYIRTYFGTLGTSGGIFPFLKCLKTVFLSHNDIVYAY